MLGNLIHTLRPLLHPMLVHFPIALLCASVAADWAGVWLRYANLTRMGYYLLVLGTAGAGVAALTGPDHVPGDATVAALLASHQSFALITVALAASLMWLRFFPSDGIRGAWALGYLIAGLALLAAVSLTGYYGGELTYHQGIGVSTSQGTLVAPSAASAALAMHVPAKPLIALIGFLTVVGASAWFLLGRALVPAYYALWRQAVRREWHGSGALWTLRLGSGKAGQTAREPEDGAPRDERQPSAPYSPIGS
jgi:uncharacterized membrane protein